MTYDLTEGIYQEFTFPVSKLLKETLVYIVTSTLQPLSHEKLQVVHTRQETRSTIPLIIHIQCSCLFKICRWMGIFLTSSMLVSITGLTFPLFINTKTVSPFLGIQQGFYVLFDVQAFRG